MIRFLFLSCLWFTASICRAQSDTSFVKPSIAYAVKMYEDALKSQTYFNGAAYSELRVTKTEDPYYLSREWINGSIDYDGKHFDHVPLRFDLVNNALITQSYNGGLLELVKEKLTDFEIRDHHFKKIDNSVARVSLPSTGFYEVLYNGPTQFIAWRVKNMQKTMVNQVYTYNLNKDEKLYLEKYRYYVLFDNAYHQVSGKASMLKLFNNKKRALKEFIRMNTLDFQNNREKAMAAIAEQYDRLTKNNEAP